MGREAEDWHQTDRVDPARAAGLLALLDAPGDVAVGTALPPLAHWLYFWQIAAQSALGDDGRALSVRGVPDTGLAHRQRVGGRITFHAPFKAGVLAERASRVAAMSRKTGRDGDAASLTIRHVIRQSGGPVLTEEEDLIFTDEPVAPDAIGRVEEPAHDAVPIRFDAVRLFRYAALTFDAARLHYDQPFARVHGHPGLLVQSDLAATVLAMMAKDRLGGMSRFAWRDVAPLYGGEPARLCRQGERFWVEGEGRRLCLTAEAAG